MPDRSKNKKTEKALYKPVSDEFCVTDNCAYTEDEQKALGKDYAEFYAENVNGVYRERYDSSASVACAEVYEERIEKYSSPKPKRESGRISAFFSKYWIYFVAPIFIFGLFFVVLYAYDVYPFSQTSISNYDLLAQIVPFIEHFYDVFEGKSSLFYSTAIMGGADVFGTLAYCCVSPFTFLFLLLGKGNAYYAVSYVLPVKLSCIALSAIYYLRKRFKNIPNYCVLVLALLYAYCGYTFVSNTYINWMDFLIYMPFVVGGFERLVKEKKMRYFAISYALMIYTCFSIASFALLLVYLIFIAYVLVCVNDNERKETLFRCCMALVIAVAAALPIMVPAFFAYARSGRNTGLFENIANPLDAGHLNAKLSYVISDTCCLFLTVIYFVKNGLKKRESVFLFLVGLIIMAPVLVDEVCNLLNAGSYMSYALRFGFLNAAYALYVGAKLVDQIVDHKVKDPPYAVRPDQKERLKALNRKYLSPQKSAVTISLFALVALVGIGVIVVLNVYKLSGEESFTGPFAHSLGGIEFIGYMAMIVGALLVIGYILFKFRLTSFKALSIVMIGVFATQITFYNIYLVKGNAFDPVRYVQFNAVFDAINANHEESDDGYYYYRYKDYDNAISNDGALTTHNNSFAVFSSIIDAKNIVPTTFFGYSSNGVNFIESGGGVFFGDALLGYKYYVIHNDSYIHSSDYLHPSQNRSYNVLLDDTQQSYFQGMLNSICFPNAYTVYSGDCVFDGDYYENMTKLYNFLGGEGELFNDYTVSPYHVTYDEQNDIYTVKIYIVEEGQWYMAHDFPEEYDICYSISGVYDENSKTELSGSVINFNYNKWAPTYYFYCQLKNYGDTELSASDVASFCKGRCLPYTKIRDLNQLLQSRAADYRIEGGNTFRVHATAEGDGGYLYMNYVALDGFKITVNGHEAEFIDNGLNLMLVKLDAGENEVVIKYVSPYIWYALIGIALGAAIIAAVWLITKKMKRDKKPYGVIVIIVNVAAYLLAAAVFGFFIGYPTMVFLKKLIMLIF